jgi:hypothetical protein
VSGTGASGNGTGTGIGTGTGRVGNDGSRRKEGKVQRKCIFWYLPLFLISKVKGLVALYATLFEDYFFFHSHVHTISSAVIEVLFKDIFTSMRCRARIQTPGPPSSIPVH